MVRVTLMFLSLMSFAAVVRAADGTLTTTLRSFPTGDHVAGNAYNPYGQVVADFDGDGHLDVAHADVAGSFDATKRFSVCWGVGDGTFSAPSSYKDFGYTMDIVAADFNRDGTTDVALCQSDQGVDGQNVLVFLSHGDRTFAAEKRFVVGKGPTGLAAVDVDNDGDTDLVTANWYWGESDVTVLRNDGLGSFGNRADFAIPGVQPYKVVAGDLNGDGYADLAVSVYGGVPAVSLLFNDGSGAFGLLAQYASQGGGYSYPGIAIADMDRDGDLDVLYAAAEPKPGVPSPVALFRNRGDGTLAPVEAIAGTFGSNAIHEFAIGDVNLDGWPDIVGIGLNWNFGYVLIPSNGSGGFGKAIDFRTGEMSRAIDLADLDHDGDLDVVVTNMASDNFSVHRNDHGSLDVPAYYTTGFTMESDTADIDHDGDLDLVTLDSRIVTFKNHGDGTFAITTVAPLLSELNHPKLRDLNGDQFADLMMLKNTTTGSGAYDFYTTMNQGDGTFGPVTQWPLGSSGTGDCDTLDADEDGDLDVVITEYLGSPGSDGRKLYLLFNKGDGRFQPPVLIKDFTTTQPERVVTGDFTNDGHADIVTGTGAIVAWVGHGNGTFSGPIISGAGDNSTKFLAAADFNADGILDLAATGWSLGTADENLAVMLGYGDGEFAPPSVHYGMFSLNYSGVGGLEVMDVDHDGHLDIVAGAYGGDAVAVFPNQGNGTFGSERYFGLNGSSLFTRTGDFDGDGMLDLAVNTSRGLPFENGVTFLFGRHAPPFELKRMRTMR